jgi:hypothetical protein
VRQRLRRFSIHQTALTVAALYFLLSIIIVPFVYFASRMSATPGFSGVLAIFIPVLYAVFGYVFTAIGCWIYNLIAGWSGGIEVELEPGGAPTMAA